MYSDFDQTISKIHVFKQLAGWEPGVDAPHALSERGQIHRLKMLNANVQYICQSSNGMVVPCAAGAKGSSWTACALGGLTDIFATPACHTLSFDHARTGIAMCAL